MIEIINIIFEWIKKGEQIVKYVEQNIQYLWLSTFARDVIGVVAKIVLIIKSPSSQKL